MRAELLRQGGTLNWISELSEPVVQALQSNAIIRPYAASSLVYQMGDRPDCLYQILEGAVRISNVSDGGKELIYAEFSPGDCLGEMSIIDHQPSPQTATLTTSGLIAAIPRLAFNKIARQHPEVYEAILRNFSHKLRRFSQSYFGALIDNIEIRLAATLENFARDENMQIAISHEDLAKFVGASRQSVSIVLKRWEAANLIRIGYGYIQIQDPQRLRRIVHPTNSLF